MNRKGTCRRLPVRLAGTVLAGLFLSACSSILGGPGISVSQTGQESVQAVPAGTSPEDAVIGRREHPLIVASYGGVYNHRRTEVMLARIVSKLLIAAQQPQSSFTITILDSAQINAFALPGGYIYVTRGILALASDSSELAAVLAHEIAHVTLRHARARTNRVATSELVDKVITGVLGGNVETDQGAARSRLSLAAFSQAQELAADEEGIRIAGRAGFDPRAAARFLSAMGRFANQGGEGTQKGADFLSSHPSTPYRVQKAVEIARSFGAPGLVQVDRAGYLAAIDGIVFGPSPDQGTIAGQQFIHSNLKFTFSLSGRFALQNTRDAVVGIASDGEAVRFDSAEVPRSMELSDYLKSGWISGLDPTSVQDEIHNGVKMASGIARTKDWFFRITALRFEGEVYRFIFAARRDSASFRQAARESIESFRKVRSSDLSKIHESVISLVKARPGDSADILARRMRNVPGGETLFYLLNHLFAGDSVEPGVQYKIVTIK